MRIMEIYAYARRFMAERENPKQWEPANWPPEVLLEDMYDSFYNFVFTYYGFSMRNTILQDAKKGDT